MSSIEQYVRQTQLPAVEKPRQKLLVPSRAGAARTAKGGPAAAQPVGQTHFKDIAASSSGSQTTVTPLPAGDVTLLGHVSGTAVDISQTSSLVLRTSSPLHILKFSCGSRDVGGDRVWKCRLFIEPSDVPWVVEGTARTDNASFYQEMSGGDLLYRFWNGEPIYGVTVTAEGQPAVVGTHYDLVPLSSDRMQELEAFAAGTTAVIPPLYVGITGEWSEPNALIIHPQFFIDFGETAAPSVSFYDFNLPPTAAYLQITSAHGFFWRGISSSGAVELRNEVGFLTDDYGNERLDPLSNSVGTVKFDLSVRFDNLASGQINPVSRRGWYADLVYFERTDEFLLTSYMPTV